MPQSIAAQVLYEFLVSCATVRTPDELSASLVDTVGKLGFNQVNVAIMRDHTLPSSALKFGAPNTYPEDWQTYYTQHNCLRYDPVVQRAHGDMRPFFWKDLPRLLDLSSQQNSFLGLSGDAGLNNGVGIPFFGSRSLRGGIALATSSPQAEHLRDLTILSSIADAFYRKLRSLYAATASGPPYGQLVVLTEREIDILNLSAVGHSDRTIAAFLSLSENTVNTHCRKIFHKLGANNRVHAVTLAVKMGFIEPP